jgi:hypothetical protein
VGPTRDRLLQYAGGHERVSLQPPSQKEQSQRKAGDSTSQHNRNYGYLESKQRDAGSSSDKERRPIEATLHAVWPQQLNSRGRKQSSERLAGNIATLRQLRLMFR